MIGRWLAVLTLAGCAAVNPPLNRALSEGANVPVIAEAPPGETYVALAFSGGGMRASAFAYGMTEALRAAGPGPHGLLSEVRLVSGVSGGSVTAAQLGLYGPAGLVGYRERYLLTDAERYMANSPFNPLTIARGLAGGANGRATFGRYLDEVLFKGATFGDLRARSGIVTWINATDIANNTPFLFSPETFDALCSDFASFPISDAVAASAAFPLVFSPIVLEAHRGACDWAEPDWLTAARFNPEASSAMRAHARALESYSEAGQVKFVKLLDGGITDNFGTTGLAVERARARAAYAPMTPQQAVRLKRMLFLVANAGVEVDYGWTQRLPGPGGVQLAQSIAAASLSAATRAGYDAMRGELRRWEGELVAWRCALPAAEVRRLRGTLAGWDCRDVKFFVGEVSFDALDAGTRARLNAVPTRLRLKPEEVDLVIDAGRRATEASAEFNGFLHATAAAPVAARMGAQGGRRIAPARTVAVTP
jgi:NTE family protein